MYSGILDSLTGIISNLGLNATTASLITRAYVSPSISNIEAVKDAFTAQGTTVPPEILAILQKRYADSASAYPSVYAYSGLSNFADYLPWILAGAALFLLVRKK